MPDSRRGVPNTVQEPGKNKERCAAPDGWHLSDAELHASIDRGIAECIHVFMQLLGCRDGLDMDLTNPDHFFANPVKHFPDGDVYNAGVDQDHEWFKAQAEEREDQGWNRDGDAGDANAGDAPDHDIAAQ